MSKDKASRWAASNRGARETPGSAAAHELDVSVNPDNGRQLASRPLVRGIAADSGAFATTSAMLLPMGQKNLAIRCRRSGLADLVNLRATGQN
jgi:hypothetical protein